MVAAVLASDWCQKTSVFFRPISSQQTYGSFCVSLRWMIHEWQLLAMFVWAVRRGFARDEKFQSQHKIFKGFPSDFMRESHQWICWTFRRYRNSSVFESFLKHSPIHWCIIWFPLDDIYINVLSRFLASLAVIETLPIVGINSFDARARQLCRATGNTACTTLFVRQKSQLRHRHLSVIESCSRWAILIRKTVVKSALSFLWVKREKEILTVSS